MEAERWNQTPEPPSWSFMASLEVCTGGWKPQEKILAWPGGRLRGTGYRMEGPGQTLLSWEELTNPCAGGKEK